jgi:hypothetical protein
MAMYTPCCVIHEWGTARQPVRTKMQATWESMWAAFLAEAAQISSAPLLGGGVSHARHATSVILARASWETFTNEFIEWRKLPRELKGSPFQSGITGIFQALGAPAPDRSRGSIWYALELVVQLRNAIVHHAAAPRTANEFPGEIEDRMKVFGLLRNAPAAPTWERRAFTGQTSAWCCRVTGEAILALEGMEGGQVRSYASVERAVKRALTPLETVLTIE